MKLFSLNRTLKITLFCRFSLEQRAPRSSTRYDCFLSLLLYQYNIFKQTGDQNGDENKEIVFKTRVKDFIGYKPGSRLRAHSPRLYQFI